jgi:DNA-binding NarL/FixJ family response regulator
VDSAVSDAVTRSLSGKINLLIVEDDETLLSTLAALFSISSIAVTTASTIDDARNAISRGGNGWHCWIIDLCLGGKENAGIALIEEHNNFPFAIVYSGIGSMESASHAIQEGAEAVIDKGYGSTAKLIREVCELAPLAVLCGGKILKSKEALFLLKNHIIREPKEWAKKSGVSLRQIENICSTHTGMPPSLVIPFYYGLRYVLESDLGGKATAIKKEPAFYASCVDFLQKNLPKYQGLLFRQ